jgi:hypothetical protein
MAANGQMPDNLDPEQMRQMQQMLAMAGGMGSMMPPLPPAYGSGFPGSPPIDPTMAQAYMQMLAYLQQGLQQPGMMPPVPGAGFPGMAPPFPGGAPGGAPGAAGEPTVRVSVEGMKFQYQLTEDDIHKVFRRYGQVKTVTVDEACSSAMVSFHNASDAQAAINDLDGKVLNGLDGTLRISWVSGAAGPAGGLAGAGAPYPGAPLPFPTLGFPQAGASPWQTGPSVPGAPVDVGAAPGPCGGDPMKTSHVKGAKKYTCRFLIGIDNDKDFQVARRLIGSKGSNMKKIVRQTEAKLRLRGVGSGYLEGASQKESTEPLQLCVSCTSAEGYKTAVHQVEELLGRVHEEYRQFCRENNLPIPDLHINLSENQLVYSATRGGAGAGMGGNGSPSAGAGGFTGALGDGAPGSPKKESRRRQRAGAKRGGGGKAAVTEGDRGEPGPNAPSVDEIQGLINERNEARRSCNFAEADRIRELLHSRGVALMDEPGGRGKGAEVTTWRYWRD